MVKTEIPKLKKILISAGIWIAVLVILFAKSMFRSFDHDENMYVTAAVMLSKGLIPYRDFPYTHLPNLLFIYLPFVSIFKEKLFITRLINVVASWVYLFLLFTLIRENLNKYKWSSLSSFLFTLSLIFNSIFIYTSGLSWNHDIPVLFLILSILLLYSLMDNSSPAKALMLGFSLGMASFSRISYSFFLIPARLILGNLPEGQRLNKFFYLGVIISSIPSVILFFICPNRFILHTITSHLLDSEFWKVHGYQSTLTLSGKLNYIAHIFIGDLTNFSLILLLVTVYFLTLLKGNYKDRKFKLLTLLLVFSIPGAILPSPLWLQYLFPLIPISILVISRGIYLLTPKFALILPIFLIIFSAKNILIYGELLKKLNHTELYVPNIIHFQGEKLKELCYPGKVLTLCPIYPVEANLNIYPAFADGPFTWRYFFYSKKAPAYIVTPKSLPSFLRTDPPSCVLVKCEKRILERPLIRWAEENGYRPALFFGKVVFSKKTSP